eukprot:scaffold44468_cov29-Attheya_sp.AAC.2
MSERTKMRTVSKTDEATTKDWKDSCREKLTYQSMDDHRTAQDVEVHQGGDVGTYGVENGRDRDSMLATDDAEADKENFVPPP